MNCTRVAISSLCIGVLAALAIEGTAVAGDQTVAGVTVTKDAKISAMLPEKYAGKLRFGTNAPFPPFEYFDDKQEMVGFDIDVAKAVAAKLGAEVSFTNLKFEGLIPGLQSHNIDAVISHIADTHEREKVVSFVDYATSGMALMVATSDNSIKDLIDLCGKTVGRANGDAYLTHIGKIQPMCESAGKKPIEVKSYPDANDAILGVMSGGLAAAMNSTSAAYDVVKSASNKGKLKVVLSPDRPQGWAPYNVGIAVLKSETDLTGAIAAATEALKADGTLDAIGNKYGVPHEIIKKVVVNAPTNFDL